MTILGDLAQSTTPAGQRDWDDALRLLRLADAGAEVAHLTIGYRVPAPILDVANRLCRGLAIGAPRDFEIPNAGLNRLRFDGERFELLVWGDIGHWQDSLDEL